MDMNEDRIDETVEITLLINFFINEGTYVYIPMICLCIRKLYNVRMVINFIINSD